MMFEINKNNILKAVSAILVIFTVFIAGILIGRAEDKSDLAVINSMFVVPKFESGVHTYNDVYIALTEQIKNEEIVKNYLIKNHSTSNKDKVFEAYYDILINCCSFFNNVNWNVSDDSKSITIWNERFKKGYKDIFGYSNEKSIHITPVMEKNKYSDEDIIGALKITYPLVPFIKIVYSGEGGFRAEVNYKYLNDTYAKYLGPEMKDFLKVKMREESDLEGHTYYNDGAVTLSKTQLMNWIIIWQDFRAKHPNFRAKEVDQRLHRYTSDFVVAYENSFFCTFDYENNLLPEVKKDYETFLNKVNPDTPEYKIVKKCYGIIKANNYKYSENLSTCLQEWESKCDDTNFYEILD